MKTVTRRKRELVVALGLLAVVLAATACGGDGKSSTKGSAEPAEAASTLPQGSEPVDLDPADFTIEIDNPYWPMSPGNVQVPFGFFDEGVLMTRDLVPTEPMVQG